MWGGAWRSCPWVLAHEWAPQTPTSFPKSEWCGNPLLPPRRVAQEHPLPPGGCPGCGGRPRGTPGGPGALTPRPRRPEDPAVQLLSEAAHLPAVHRPRPAGRPGPGDRMVGDLRAGRLLGPCCHYRGRGRSVPGPWEGPSFPRVTPVLGRGAQDPRGQRGFFSGGWRDPPCLLSPWWPQWTLRWPHGAGLVANAVLGGPPRRPRPRPRPAAFAGSGRPGTGRPMLRHPGVSCPAAECCFCCPVSNPWHRAPGVRSRWGRALPSRVPRWGAQPPTLSSLASPPRSAPAPPELPPSAAPKHLAALGAAPRGWALPRRGPGPRCHLGEPVTSPAGPQSRFFLPLSLRVRPGLETCPAPPGQALSPSPEDEPFIFAPVGRAGPTAVV